MSTTQRRRGTIDDATPLDRDPDVMGLPRHDCLDEYINELLAHTVDGDADAWVPFSRLRARCPVFSWWRELVDRGEIEGVMAPSRISDRSSTGAVYWFRIA